MERNWIKSLNPKSIDSNDLYGKYINIQIRVQYGILFNIVKEWLQMNIKIENGLY